jgi:hypothetical protein
MIGIDAIGALLVWLALTLMAVSPLHVTIARSKVKSAAISAQADDRDDTPDGDPGTPRNP